MTVDLAAARTSWIGSAAMTDQRPEPRYGEYAPIGSAPTFGSTPGGEQPSPTPASRRRTWDVLLTAFLLVLGVFDVVRSYGEFAHLDATLRTLYADQGWGDYTSASLALTAGLIANAVRIALLTIAIAVSLALIAKNRLAFFVPLSAAVAAGLVVLACVLIAVLGDPALMQYVQNQSPPL